MGRAEAPTLRIEVVYCPRPGQTDSVTLLLPEGSTVRGAVAASGLCARHALNEGSLQAGVWGRALALGAKLRDRDRVELYRPLQVDPKDARRLRYKRAKRPALR